MCREIQQQLRREKNQLKTKINLSQKNESKQAKGRPRKDEIIPEKSPQF